MVQTRNTDGSNPGPDPIATQLAAIAAKLEAMERLKDDVAALKSHAKKSGTSSGKNNDGESSKMGGRQFRPYNKIEFPTYSDGDLRGWILKAEKYFRYYHIPDEEKVDVASMHLEGDALDLFSCLKQTGTVQEYRQEFAKRSSRVTNWPDHCLLGVFLNGLKEELKSDVRIHKPRTVYKAMSLALEFESKASHVRSSRLTAWSAPQKTLPSDLKPNPYSSTQTNPSQKPPMRISDIEKQSRYLRGECFRCGENYGSGHRCKTGTLKLCEKEGEIDNPIDVEDEETSVEPQENAMISLNDILGNPHPTTMKVYSRRKKKVDRVRSNDPVNSIGCFMGCDPYAEEGWQLEYVGD
ncbi:hypothetical protein E3N88_10312 [Mikania micrantha]|uniref:Retrotransposon gag domain-containing protein n=1 Tax=Mikania micrantha TaxID=192012 RepID=A0A5N6PA49_9ASTR|nr:hypothetical protein E3N88_10312 [Mikania micrantha]